MGKSHKFLSTAGFLFAVFIGIGTVGGSWYTIDEGERGVKLRNGAFVAIVDPGLGFKLPWFESIVEFSIRTQKLPIDLATYSKDIQPADVNMVLNYRVAEVDKVYRTLGLTFAETYLQPIVLDETKAAFGQFVAVDIIGRREELAKKITDAIVKRTASSGIIVEAVNIANIDFSDSYEQAVEARMTAEVEVQKAKQTLEQEKIQADIARTQAQGRADSAVTAAKAEGESIRIRGEAEASAIDARGKAIRENPGLVDLTVAEKWNGSLPSTMVPGGTMPFLDVWKSAKQ